MADEAPRHEVLLREYQEAGEICRAHATLIRTGVSIVTAANAAIFGFLAALGQEGGLARILLISLGLWVSGVAFLSSRRLFARYDTYMKRAHAIEEELGMELYRCSDSRLPQPEQRTRLRGKYLWPSVPAATFVMYIILVIEAGCRSVT